MNNKIHIKILLTAAILLIGSGSIIHSQSNTFTITSGQLKQIRLCYSNAKYNEKLLYIKQQETDSLYKIISLKNETLNLSDSIIKNDKLIIQTFETKDKLYKEKIVELNNYYKKKTFKKTGLLTFSVVINIFSIYYFLKH